MRRGWYRRAMPVDEKPPALPGVDYYAALRSDRTGDLTGTQAAGAHVDVLGSAVNDRLHAADVGLPGTVGASVGVGDLNTKGHALAANITFRHFSAPPSALVQNAVSGACERTGDGFHRRGRGFPKKRLNYVIT